MGSTVGGSQDLLLERNHVLLLLHLAAEAVVDGIENVVDGDAGLVGRLGTLLVDTSLDEDAVPVVISHLVDGVGATDVTLGSVTDEVDGGGRSNETVLSVAPLAHETRSELEGRDLGLAEGVGVQLALATSEVLEGNLEHAAESAHAETDVLVGSRPDNIVVGEVERRTLVESLGSGAEAATLRHGEVEHDLDVAGPVARVGEDEDGIDDTVGEVTLTRVGMLLSGELAERGSGRVVLDDVARSNNVLEAVTLSNEAALLALTANDEDGAVLLSHLPHGGVAADELARLNVALQLTGEVAASLLFRLTTTVGEENVRAINKRLVSNCDMLYLWVHNGDFGGLGEDLDHMVCGPISRCMHAGGRAR